MGERRKRGEPARGDPNGNDGKGALKEYGDEETTGIPLVFFRFFSAPDERPSVKKRRGDGEIQMKQAIHDVTEDDGSLTLNGSEKGQRWREGDEVKQKPWKKDDFEKQLLTLIRRSSVDVHEMRDGLRTHEEPDDDGPDGRDDGERLEDVESIRPSADVELKTALRKRLEEDFEEEKPHRHRIVHAPIDRFGGFGILSIRLFARSFACSFGRLFHHQFARLFARV